MASRIRRLSVFGHVRRLPEATPAHSVLCLAVDTRAGYRSDNRLEWKRRRGRPCRAWMQQIEEDSGLNVNDAWRIAHDSKSWRALRPVAGQAVQWSEVTGLGREHADGPSNISQLGPTAARSGAPEVRKAIASLLHAADSGHLLMK